MTSRVEKRDRERRRDEEEERERKRKRERGRVLGLSITGARKCFTIVLVEGWRQIDTRLFERLHFYRNLQ